jgi:hypothetical protein
MGGDFLPTAKVASDALVALLIFIAIVGLIWWVVRYIREFFARHWVSDSLPKKSSLKKNR